MIWASEELVGIDLGDQRLNAHSVKWLSQSSKKPPASIPKVCRG